MDAVFVTAFLKTLLMPLFFLILLIPAIAIRVLIQRKMRDGKLKQFLLRKT